MQINTLESDRDRYTEGRTGLAIFAWISTLLGRVLYYGVAILFYSNLEALGAGERYGLNLFLTTTMIALPGLGMGQIMDYLLDQRWGVAIGHLLSAMGLFLMLTKADLLILVGVGFLFVGLSSVRVGNIAYFGSLISRKGRRLEGGYALLYAAISLAALPMVLMMLGNGSDSESSMRTLLLICGVLSLLMGLVWTAMILKDWLPANPGARPGSPARKMLGVLFAVLMVPALMVLMYLLNRMRFDQLFLARSCISLALCIAAFVFVGRQPSIQLARRNAILATLLFAQMLTWTLMSSWGTIFRLQTGFESGATWFFIQHIGLVILAVALGILLVRLGSGSRKDLGENGIGMMAGLGMQVLAGGLGFMMLFFFSGSYLFSDAKILSIIVLVLVSIGDLVWFSFSNATLMRLAPAGGTATAFAIMGAMPSLEFLLLVDQPMDIGGPPSFLGLFTLGADVPIIAVAAGLGIALMVLLRNFGPDRE